MQSGNDNTGLGTKLWADKVFSSPPAVNNKGRSKHTQYHQRYIASNCRMVGAQGRVEYCSLLMLQLLQTLGLIRRIKEQPFETDSEEFGAQVRPDFLAERTDYSFAIIESKTERFLTRDRHLILDENRRRFASFGLDYLVWSDKHPLNHSARHNLINMTRFAGENIPREELDELSNLVNSCGQTTVRDLYLKENFDLGCIFAAAWMGRIHFPINEALTECTVVSSRPVIDLASVFLGCQRVAEPWWKSLQ